MLLLALALSVACAQTYRLELQSDQKAFGRELVSFMMLQARIGTPPQSLQLLADTGSWAPIVMTDACQASVCVREPRFNASSSASFDVVRTGLKNQYGAGTFEFSEATDEFCFGGAAPACFHKPLQLHFGAIVDGQAGGGALFGSFSGIIGLGLPGQGLVLPSVTMYWRSERFVSFDLPRGDFGLPTPPGELLVGRPNASAYEGPLTWTKVLPDDGEFVFWNIAITGVGINGKQGSTCSVSSPCPALVDSGGGGFQSVGIQEWAGQLSIKPDCSNLHSMPNISLSVEGTEFVFTPTDYVRRVDGVCICEISGAGRRRFRQLPGTLPRPYEKMLRKRGAQPQFVLGVPFLQRVFTVFDAGDDTTTPRLGLAPRKGNH